MDGHGQITPIKEVVSMKFSNIVKRAHGQMHEVDFALMERIKGIWLLLLGRCNGCS